MLELLHLGGRSLPHAVLMMIPEAWERHETMKPEHKAFYRYHASLMEPWTARRRCASPTATSSAPSSTATVCARAAFGVTKDGLVVMASEVGVLDVDHADVVQKLRLQPGRMFPGHQGRRIADDEEIKDELAAQHPYQQWLDGGAR